ncbi:hypothetical protein ABZ208_01040 [Streptomyces sp. NPDC006208]|uniref:hypothetical protein n=1 Tax=Streptomyces sp. NPDC006208 TaxID=3156734 RepID=UPI0033BCF910
MTAPLVGPGMPARPATPAAAPRRASASASPARRARSRRRPSRPRRGAYAATAHAPASGPRHACAPAPSRAPAPTATRSPDSAGAVVRWGAFSCLLVPVVLVAYGSSAGEAASVALGLAAVTAACRVLLRRSERTAALSRTDGHRGARPGARRAPGD